MRSGDTQFERLTAAGMNWQSFTEEYLESTWLFRDAVIAMLAMIAKHERIRGSEAAFAAIHACTFETIVQMSTGEIATGRL